MSISNMRNRPGRGTVDLDRFFSLSVDMLCIVGFDGYFKHVNPSWERTLGWTAQELTARPWSKFVHPEDLARSLSEESRQTVHGQDAISFEHRFLAKDGSYHWLRWDSTPSLEQHEMHAVARDVTEQKHAELELQALNAGLERKVAERTRAAEARALHAERAEQALRDLEARAQAILVTAVDAIISIDEMGIIESLNPATERLFGYLAEEMVGKSISMLMPSPFREEHAGHLANYRRTGEQRIFGIGREVIGQRRDGSTFPMDLAVSEVLLDDRRIFTGIIRDISERKRAEQALEEISNELRRSNGELEAFVYSVSHDLKEPLRTLEAFSQFLMSEYADQLDENGKDYLKKLAVASVRMKQLIDAVLLISRIGRQEQSKEMLSVEGVAAQLVHDLRAMLNDRKATVHIAPDMPAVFASRRHVEQVLRDLIVNAIKFNRSEAPHVEIGADLGETGEVTFYVRDNGVGIESEYYDRVFGLFQRLHRREEFEGTGAGLAIVKRAVEALGGRIWIESELGKGSTFYFTLCAPPVHTESPAANKMSPRVCEYREVS